MAIITMSPTSDVYVNHTLYPEGSTSAYALINDAVSDGSSTYIAVSCPTADTRYTASSAFMFSGTDIVLSSTECAIDNISAYATSAGLLYSSATVTCQIESEGRILTSDATTGGIMTFNSDGSFEETLTKYFVANGRLPDIKMVLTTHASATKDSQSFGITRIYISIQYSLRTYVKSTKRSLGLFGGVTWTPISRIYEKVNGTWTETTASGKAQLTNHINKIGHDLVGLNYIAPGCSSTGKTAGSYCNRCSTYLVPQETIPATGNHTLTDKEGKDPTCGSAGYTASQYCSTCFQYFGRETIPATGNHTPVDVVYSEPTCGTAGYTAGTRCETCGTYLSGHEIIPATGNHTPVDFAAIEPTCGTAGYTAGTRCETCGTYLSGHESIPATGNHTPVSNNDAIPATSLDMGMTDSIICSVCGTTLTEGTPLPCLGHTCTPVTIPAVAPTCISTGLTEGSKCSVCGRIMVHQQVVPVSSTHNYVTRDGYEICSVCGYVPSLGLTLSVNRADSLDTARSGLSATSIGDYAIFGGGGTADKTDAYTPSLTKVSVSLLQSDNINYRNAAASNNSYALFGGGEATNGATACECTTAYSASLTRTYPADLDTRVSQLAAASNGNYALFGGGYTNNASIIKEYSSYVKAYDTSLTASTQTALSNSRSKLAATSVGSYILFGGGTNGSVTNIVDTYNASLTRGAATALSVARDDLAATSIGNYAIFGGGWNNGYVNTTDAYDASLTKVSIAALSVARQKLAATSTTEYALFGGGEGSDYVDIYNESLTKMPSVKLSSARYFLAATSLGAQALFGGGNDGSDRNIVDVFSIK